ncbi:MAG: patatin family protein [Clostridia bacterium]
MKLGLVLEGGASRAIFSAGVMDCFLDNNIEADVVVGVSAGISNAMSYLSKQKGRAVEIAEKYTSDKRYMGIKHLFDPKNKSYYNIDFVFSEIPQTHYPYDCDTYASGKGKAFAGVTNIETGEIEFMLVPANDKTWKTLVASCALPILFQPVEIEGKKYLDGGIADSVPVDKAMDEGCDKIIVITTREKSYVKEGDKGAAISAKIYKKYPKLSYLLKNRAKLYNKVHQNLINLEKEGKIFWIAPCDTSSWGRTDKSPEKIRAMYTEGYETAEKLLPELYKYLS